MGGSGVAIHHINGPTNPLRFELYESVVDTKYCIYCQADFQACNTKQS